ncbi:hypothetical protein [Corynebacterium striatum]|uniref:hypothetical protein n=1 Tax=Corynebacterium striatum TaxID=43770 RepID=UPI0027B97490|nr:hypothetical protein [Corynebacterium striatum]
MAHRLDRKSPPTQVQHPWRSTVRATLTATLALIPLLPEIARAAGIETIPAVASVLAVVAAIQRVITLPAVDSWLTKYLHLGAKPNDKDIR